MALGLGVPVAGLASAAVVGIGPRRGVEGGEGPQEAGVDQSVVLDEASPDELLPARGAGDGGRAGVCLQCSGVGEAVAVVSDLGEYYSTGDPRGAVDLVEAALSQAPKTGSARLTSMLHARVCRAHAHAGDTRAADRSANAALDAYEHAGPIEDDLPCVYWYNLGVMPSVNLSQATVSQGGYPFAANRLRASDSRCEIENGGWQRDIGSHRHFPRLRSSLGCGRLTPREGASGQPATGAVGHPMNDGRGSATILEQAERVRHDHSRSPVETGRHTRAVNAERATWRTTRHLR